MPSAFNPTDVDWFRGFAFFTPFGGNVISLGELQEISFDDAYTMEHMRGPNKLTPVAAGISERNVSGSARWGKPRTPQLEGMRGGVDAFASAKSTWTSKADEEPTVFDLHVLSPLDGSDLQAYFYNCLFSRLSIPLSQHGFVYPGVDFEVYGQDGAAGLLYKWIESGDQTTSN